MSLTVLTLCCIDRLGENLWKKWKKATWHEQSRCQRRHFGCWDQCWIAESGRYIVEKVDKKSHRKIPEVVEVGVTMWKWRWCWEERKAIWLLLHSPFNGYYCIILNFGLQLTYCIITTTNSGFLATFYGMNCEKNSAVGFFEIRLHDNGKADTKLLAIFV